LAATQQAEIAAVRLYVLADGGNSPDDFRQRVRQLIRAEVGAIQLRDKTLTDRELLQRARLLCEEARGAATLTLINDRPDVAVLAGADGVHLGQDDLDLRQVRRLVGPQLIVGVSAHSLRQAQQAVHEGADYLGVGPVFPSLTKQFATCPGLELLQQVHRQIHLPAFAIGGITLDHVAAVLATGIQRVAVCSAVWQSATPTTQVRKFMRHLTRDPTDADSPLTDSLTADERV
jgi:thiamine-phosphate pyrophosphorylase